MLSCRILRHALQLRNPSICVACSIRSRAPPPQRLFSAASVRRDEEKRPTRSDGESKKSQSSKAEKKSQKSDSEEQTPVKKSRKRSVQSNKTTRRKTKKQPLSKKIRRVISKEELKKTPLEAPVRKNVSGPAPLPSEGVSIKDAMLGTVASDKPKKAKRKKATGLDEALTISTLTKDSLHFEPLEITIPPVPMLGYGLDRVLFNPGVYRLQDPRSRIYNFDPYLEAIMPVQEFDFDALTAYKTSSQDESLLSITREHGTKFTGSTSSMSGVLSHFHHLLSCHRTLNHKMLSQTFASPSNKFSKVSRAPTSIFLRRKNGVHAIDADKSHDSPNVMSWLGHSMEKLLTCTPEEFEKFRRSNPAERPKADDSARCFHYSKQGNFLMRSQLDAHDPRLPGTGIFDVKTRAVVSIRMNAEEYETGLGYQLRYDHGEWESYEREFYDMSRATMLKYSLQVRMGRMDGIFVAYHNIERMFGFQYLSLADLDLVLHGQNDPCLGDQEFKMSVHLLDEVLQRATEEYPDTDIRLTFHTVAKSPPYMTITAEPFTSEEVDTIQATNKDKFEEFKRKVIGVGPDESEIQAEWRDIQERVNEELEADESEEPAEEDEPNSGEVTSNKPPEDSGGEVSLETEATAKAATTSSAVHDPKPSKKPLMGWTLTVRNRVNGATVERPTDLDPSDNWTLEYHMQEIPVDGREKVHLGLRKLINDTFGQDQETRNADLKFYRQKIQRWTEAGREWQEQQKQIDEKLGKQLYRPLGPGSEAASAKSSSATSQTE